MKKLLFIWLFLIPVILVAQVRFRITGKIMDSKNNEKIEFAAIQIKELNRWTTSDNNGGFSFGNLPLGTYTLEATCVGFERYSKTIEVNSNISGFILIMNVTTLGLEEITVIAKENTNLSSSSRIERTALSHIQPTSLADVMQLVPGQVTLNPDLSKSNQISIRDINSASNPDANSAMGTAIIVDGTPVNNNANMQTLNTAGSGTAQSYSTAGQGIDLRQISTDNIESIEVIRGIPSVQYGNLTTGAVLVKTKAGKTKIEAKIKSDPNIKQAAFSKGLIIPGGDFGAMNVDFDYTHAFDDIRIPSRSYRRVTGQMGYSRTFFRGTNPLSLNAKALYYSTFDNSKTDEDMLKTEILKSKEESMGFKLFGNWSVKKTWLTGLEYNFSGNFDKQYNYEYIITSGSTIPMTSTRANGESKGEFLPSSYYSEYTLDGKPFNYFGMLKANITGKYGKINNHFFVGTEWRTSGNKGLGKIYNELRPPSAAISTRPRAFKDIPFSNDLSLFIEDKLTLPIGESRLVFQGGLRYNNLLPDGIFSSKPKGYRSIEPRVNLIYEIIKEKKSRNLSDLSFRFGYGKTSKNPGMIFLYPDKSYKDEFSFNYYPDLVVITTRVDEDTSNPNLKPSTNTKFETGLDFTLFGINVMLTGFKENLTNGFDWFSNYFVMNFRKWDQLQGAGKNPVFANGNITYIENAQTKTLGFTTDQKFRSFNTPVNNYEIRKKGFEYVLNFGRIKPVKSELIIDGAYFNIARIDDVIPFRENVTMAYLGKRFPFLPVYAGNKGTVRQRLNSNIKLNTHIPILKLVTSVTGMLVWFEKTNYYWKDENGNHLAYSIDKNNEKIYGQYTNVDKIYIDPIGFYDLNYAFQGWQNNMSFENPYYFMVKDEKYNYFDTEVVPFHWQINLKLTKEIGSVAKFSFFANNVFNYRPLHKYKRSDSYARQNQSAYFGAELKLTL